MLIYVGIYIIGLAIILLGITYLFIKQNIIWIIV